MNQMMSGIKESFLAVYAELKDVVSQAISKANSRKFVVFLFATHMTYQDILMPESWTNIAMLFMGVQFALDWRKNELPGPTRADEPENQQV